MKSIAHRSSIEGGVSELEPGSFAFCENTPSSHRKPEEMLNSGRHRCHGLRNLPPRVVVAGIVAMLDSWRGSPPSLVPWYQAVASFQTHPLYLYSFGMEGSI